MLVLLRSTLDQLQQKDTAQIFAEPVDIKEVRGFTVTTPVQSPGTRCLQTGCIESLSGRACWCQKGPPPLLPPLPTHTCERI
ncbi:hypothetical protein EYF80_068421 [Liparis tanakae]|uniref:Uncharacterized protein n=1 Tax=Liparis tanakae TaxID=230148 RepID=A0A4Z2DYH2_9TELE|nr:hypothetical protein EYF80_068421 [Liparis tanakae]